MIDVVEVLQKIYGHLRGDIDLASFREWMVGAQLDLEAHRDSHAHDLVWQLEIFYAEHSDGLADEALWRKSLAHLADKSAPVLNRLSSHTSTLLLRSGFFPLELPALAEIHFRKANRNFSKHVNLAVDVVAAYLTSPRIASVDGQVVRRTPCCTRKPLAAKSGYRRSE